MAVTLCPLVTGFCEKDRVPCADTLLGMTMHSNANRTKIIDVLRVISRDRITFPLNLMHSALSMLTIHPILSLIQD